MAVILCLAGLPVAHAQDFDVSGTVVSADDGTPLPGVNIVEAGTQVGTSTDGDGNFSLTVSGANSTLVFSFVGYENTTVDVAGRSEITVEMETQTQMLEDVVVTALGIEREQRAIGYSVSKIDGEALAEVQTTNVANTLSGKIAGVDVSTPATGSAGSSRVIIRGISTLTSDNQPLYVVDGVPIDNTNLLSAGMWGGSDSGDGISAISPNDIKEVSVLKGAGAAALYGSRASNGVVLITTKSGRSTGLGITFSSNTTFEEALNYFDDYQYEYGQGTRGEKPQTVEQARQAGLSSWGARLDGSDVIQVDGEMRPYVAVRDNLDAFYRTGLTTTNTLAMNGGTEGTTFRLSVTDLRNEGIVPNSGFSRTSFLMRGSSDFGTGRLRADAKINYIYEDAHNRPRLSDSPGNPNYTVGLLPTSVSVDILKPGHSDEQGFSEFKVTENDFITNPYWAVNQFSEQDTENRIMGFGLLEFMFTDWLSAQGRVGTDLYTTRRTYVEPFGTAYDNGGDLVEDEWNISETNADLLVTADREVTPTLSVLARAGGNIRYRRFEQIGAFGDNFNIPGLITISNTQSQNPTYNFSEQQVNSLYGSAEFSYDDYLYLTLTGRNDWSSTLPVDNNSYFYPSISSSFVFSELFEMPDWLSFGKLRASWAEVGGDTDPYRLALTYRLVGQGHLGRPLGEIAQNQVPNANLKPSSKVDIEGGFEVRLFQNRLGLDLTGYRSTTYDDIVPTTISITSGFDSRVINIGEVRNTGIEALLTATPVRSGDFEWRVDFNAARNVNEVISLAEGQESLFLGQGRTRNASITADVGETYGAIVGFRYRRDPQGNIVHDADGLPLRAQDVSVLGHYPPDMRGGFGSTLSYKNFSLRTLFDFQIGGDIYSETNVFAYSNGLHVNTLRGREEGFIVGEGVVNVGTAENPVYEENTTQANPQDYFGRIAGQITEEFVYDASYVKLREMRLGYRLPPSLFAGTPIQVASLALTGRNLLILHKNVPNVDPESTYNNSNVQGLEMFGVPQTRSIGFSLDVRL